MRLLVPVALLLLAAGTAHAAWPGFHGDAKHTGFQAGADYRPYADVWWSKKLDPATQVDASPIVADGFVVLAGWDGVVRVLDAASGREVWTVTMAKIVGTPVIAGGTLFVVDTAGSLKSFDLDRGTPLYSAAVGATFGSLTWHEGKVFVGNEAGVMYAFHADTLTLLWSFATNSISDGVTTTSTGTPPVFTSTCRPAIPAGAIRGAPAVHDGKVIFGSLNTYVYAVEEKVSTGTTTRPSWVFKTSDNVFGSPAIDVARNHVLIGSFDENVYSLPVSPSGAGPVTVNGQACSAYTNAPTWRFAVPSDNNQKSKVASTPAIDGNRAYVGANNGKLYAIELVSGAGSKAWEYNAGAAIVASPAVANKIVVLAADNGKMAWLNATNGNELATFQGDSAFKASPAIDGDRTYAASYEANLYALGPAIPKRPDLVVTSVTYDGVAVNAAVENRGQADAGASTLRVLVDGALVGEVTVPALAAGQSTHLRHPADLPAGTFAYVATIDAAGIVAESDEANNALEGSVTVAAPVRNQAKPQDEGGIPGPGLAPFVVALALAIALRRKD